ncbi:LytR/AlgR family response regulator transcription factor [Spirosoma utsteinense]|uniref:DNA-binding LytR/AlgR family response regulator n=1 Tax=Spirosoma utsteinense TaxID=2585773 RepID=A0ABR6WD57_9BACT|nr:LytTR family DNA-binding domain-containing protein [Spirosoma utsteinense]MBC3788416.1 DNA-binding LytR/AlgR family response regulator [Spirosoma utsteinense]MBC3794493.1 DNA-binding LytR/AlgR family response regulator [Spirosoma utsteinense]
MIILILDADPVWQLKLQQMAEEFTDATIALVSTSKEATEFLTHSTPDAVIADIVVDGQLSFHLFTAASRTYPVIFITGQPEDDHLRQSLSFTNSAFLVKPFHLYSLVSALATRLNQYRTHTCGNLPAGTFPVMGKHRQPLQLPLSKVIYIESEGNYAVIYLETGKHTVKRALHTIIPELDMNFGRVHKSYIINFRFVNRVNLTEKYVVLNGQQIPIGRKYRQEVLSRI